MFGFFSTPGLFVKSNYSLVNVYRERGYFLPSDISDVSVSSLYALSKIATIPRFGPVQENATFELYLHQSGIQGYANRKPFRTFWYMLGASLLFPLPLYGIDLTMTVTSVFMAVGFFICISTLCFVDNYAVRRVNSGLKFFRKNLRSS